MKWESFMFEKWPDFTARSRILKFHPIRVSSLSFFLLFSFDFTRLRTRYQTHFNSPSCNRQNTIPICILLVSRDCAAKLNFGNSWCRVWMARETDHRYARANTRNVRMSRPKRNREGRSQRGERSARKEHETGNQGMGRAPTQRECAGGTHCQGHSGALAAAPRRAAPQRSGRLGALSAPRERFETVCWCYACSRSEQDCAAFVGSAVKGFEERGKSADGL